MKRKTLKHLIKVVIASCMAVSVAMGITGCGTKVKNVEGYIATLDGEDVPADLAQFMIRYAQYRFETMNWDYLSQIYGDGTDLWQVDLTGSGSTAWDSLKTEEMEELKKILLAEKHAEDMNVSEKDLKSMEHDIKAAAHEFTSSLDRKTANAFSADENVVKEFLKLRTIQNAVENRIAEGVDQNVSDEEARQADILYAMFQKDGDYTKAGAETESETVYGNETEAETENDSSTDTARNEAEKFLDAVSGQDDFEDAVHKLTASFAGSPVTESEAIVGLESSYPDPKVVESVMEVDEDGTVIDKVIEGETAYYVVLVTDTSDKDASRERKEEIIQEREIQAINDKYAEWEKDCKWEVDSEALSKINPDRHFVAPEQVETETSGVETETEKALVSSETEKDTVSESDKKASNASVTVEDMTEGGANR